jgi:hypothetical protein
VPIHDSYARITPFELLVPEEEFPGKRFPLIREEAEGRGGSLDTPESFLLLSETAVALREIRGEDDAPERVQQHGALLFQAFHFWEEGQPLLLLDTEVVRYLVSNGPSAGEWSPALPGRSGYIQLPQHLVWALNEAGELPESLDGIFWAAPDGENVTLLIVMGIRKDRPGLAVVPLPTLPLGAAAHWASMAARPEGEDFSSSLPGAELEGLYAIEAGGEAVKLAMRVFWYLDVFPGRVTDGGVVQESERSGGGGGDRPGAPAAEPTEVEAGPGIEPGPRPSRLPYRRVVLEGRA